MLFCIDLNLTLKTGTHTLSLLIRKISCIGIIKGLKRDLEPLTRKCYLFQPNPESKNITINQSKWTRSHRVFTFWPSLGVHNHES